MMYLARRVPDIRRTCISARGQVMTASALRHTMALSVSKLDKTLVPTDTRSRGVDQGVLGMAPVDDGWSELAIDPLRHRRRRRGPDSETISF